MEGRRVAARLSPKSTQLAEEKTGRKRRITPEKTSTKTIHEKQARQINQQAGEGPRDEVVDDLASSSSTSSSVCLLRDLSTVSSCTTNMSGSPSVIPLPPRSSSPFPVQRRPEDKAFAAATRDNRFGEDTRLVILPSAFSPPLEQAVAVEASRGVHLPFHSSRRVRKKRRLEALTRGTKEDPRRQEIFHRYDEGIKMDADMWWSATPEDVAVQIAARCSCPLLWDGFGGIGGNAVHFARGFCGLVIASEISPERVRMAQHNVSIH
ncbi:rna cap guanine-n2 methyltransferase, partial [Cystoisospora suis]